MRFIRLLLLNSIIFFLSNSLYSQNNPIDTLFDVSFEDLMNTNIIGASKVLQHTNEVCAKVKVITAIDIKNRGYFTLDEALMDLPGFQFRNIQSINSYIFCRGVPNQNNLMLILVDGIQINELNSGGFYGGGQYNLDNVERIEVIYGPASVIYGTNAVTGVINIVTKSALENQGFDISTLFGSFNASNIQASYGYSNPQSDFGIRISAMKKETEKGDFGGKNGGYNWSEDLITPETDYSFGTKIYYKNLTIGTNYLLKQASANAYYKAEGTEYNDFNTFWNIGFLNTHIKYDIKKFEKIAFTYRAYYRNSTVYNNSIERVTDTAQIGYFRPNWLVGNEVTSVYTPVKKLQLISGVVFENEHLAEDFGVSYSNSPYEKPIPPAKPTLLSNTLLSGFLQARYNISNNLDFICGGRLDHSSTYDNVFTPSAAFVYNRNRFNAKLMYMEAYRAPKPWDYNWGIGNLDLKPEEIKSIELTTAYNIAPHFILETSIHKNKMYNMLIKNASNNKWINSDTIDCKSVEVELQYTRKNFQSNINYTYTISKDIHDFETQEIAPHMANFIMHYSFTKSFSSDVQIHYIGERKNANTLVPIIEQAIPINCRFSYSTPYDFVFTIDFKNLFDTEYYHTSNRDVSMYRQAQRTILFGITWKINPKNEK